MDANLDDAKGLAFACLPGCGFCCTASPLVLEPEADRLGGLVRRAADGSLRIPIRGVSCSSLGRDCMCGTYEARPGVCRVYPYSVHAGRRIQATLSLACPGIEGWQGPLHTHAGEPMRAEGSAIVAFVLAQPGAADMAARAKQTFAEFDRRMKEWNVHAPPDKLRTAFLPHLDRLALPQTLPAFFAGLAEGDLVLGRNGASQVGDLFEAEPEGDLADLIGQGAREAFEANADALWVEGGFDWTVPTFHAGNVQLARYRPDAAPTTWQTSLEAIPTDWTPDAALVLARHLRRLAHRDHTEGASAWIVDASGYQATPAAAYGRVLGEAALQVILRAGLLAHEAGAEEIDEALARRGVMAYETSYHSLPTLGAIL